jgi:uncharacterized protein
MKIAVIGSGISGLSAALILQQKFQVELFESDSRLGGHAHTVKVQDDSGNHLPVDTGFLVYNELTYPHFTQMMKFLNVETVDSDMSLSIQTESGIEWAGTNLSTVFAQKRNLFNPRFLNMLKDVLKFHREANENLELARKNSWTLQDLIRYRNLSTGFVNWYLLPMTGAIWSMSYDKALSFPAETFMQFCMNHRLLQVENRPTWKTVRNGSINYVNQIAKRLPVIHLNTAIRSIEPRENKLVLRCSEKRFEFDKVVLATAAPISFEILKEHFASHAEVLKNARTSENKVVLHQDQSVMPKKRQCWSSWNVQAREAQNNQHPIELTYYLNKLQPLPTRNDFYITLNRTSPLQNIKREFIYHHPQFDREMIATQAKISSIQGHQEIYFAGAWTRYGFHEDGLLSAVRVAEKLGVSTPWKI